MPTVLTRFVLFLSSYAPLMLIFAIRDPLKMRFSRYVFLTLAIVSLGLLWLFLRSGQRLAPHSITVQSAQVRDTEAMSYIVIYFLPFLQVSASNLGDAFSLLLVYAVVAVIYVNSNLIYINPVLNVVGYRLFEVASGSGKVSTLITRRDYVPSGEQLNVASLGNYVLLERSS
jgi:hypothetical protein